MSTRGICAGLAVVLCLGCGGGPTHHSPPGALPEAADVLGPDERWDKQRDRRRELLAAMGEEEPLPWLEAPDLEPRRSSIHSFGEVAEVILKVKNVVPEGALIAGARDAVGPFTVRAIISWRDNNGVVHGPIGHDEIWNTTIKPQERMDSDDVVQQSDRFQIDLRNLARPIEVTVGVYADFPTGTSSNGSVLETNEGPLSNAREDVLTIH